MKKLVGVVFLLAATATVAQAQIVTSNLQGVVTDATGAVLQGATVTAVSAETGATRETTTDSVGSYRFNLLPRGLYEVHAAVLRHGARTSALSARVARAGIEGPLQLLRDALEAGLLGRDEFTKLARRPPEEVAPPPPLDGVMKLSSAPMTQPLSRA